MTGTRRRQIPDTRSTVEVFTSRKSAKLTSVTSFPSRLQRAPRMQSRVYSLRATEPPSNPKRRQALKEEMWKTEASDTIVCQACYDVGTAQ